MIHFKKYPHRIKKYEYGEQKLNHHTFHSNTRQRKINGLQFLLNGRIMKVHFTLMVKILLERLHVKILHCSMSEEFPLVEELLMGSHSLTGAISSLEIYVVVKTHGNGGVPGSLMKKRI